MKGHPERILAAIDEYGHKNAFLMNVGHEKGEIVSRLINECKPNVMIELGGYVGYSALLFGSALKKAGGSKYISLEMSETFASVATALIRLAGLQDTVEIMIGPCRNSLRELKKVYPKQGLDMIFLDHAKTAYVNDIKLCEELELVRRGTTVVADNVISSGAPLYLQYIRSSPAEKQVEAKKVRLIQKTTPDEDISLGNPSLVYDTRLINSFEPTGEPVS